ncbi:hypothetical protein WA158_007591 [Blastocystis sp. Blastoise]
METDNSINYETPFLVNVSYPLPDGSTFQSHVVWNFANDFNSSPEHFIYELSRSFSFPVKVELQLIKSIREQLFIRLFTFPLINYTIPLDDCSSFRKFLHVSSVSSKTTFLFDIDNYKQQHPSEINPKCKICPWCHSTNSTKKHQCTYCLFLMDNTVGGDIIYNLNVCCICNDKKDEKLVSCPTCPLKYHKSCIPPQFSKDNRCSYCQQTLSFLTNKQITPTIILIYIIHRLLTFPINSQFIDDIDSSIRKDYYEQMYYPIYLKLVISRLVANKYHTLNEVIIEIRQIYRNCRVYNNEKSQIFEDSIYLQRFFDCMIWQWMARIRELPK